MGNTRRGQVRRIEESGSKKLYVLAGTIVALLLIGFIALVIIDSRRQAGGGGNIAGVEDIDVGQANQHSQGNIDYDQTPPAGGEHNPVWQNCGFYSEPIRNENAVHSLEHGAVWITYQPDLRREQVQQLRELAQSQTYILVSPYPDLPAPVVATAWGKQIQLDGADDPRLDEFIRAYRQGPQTPEPGATCGGGIGEPA